MAFGFGVLLTEGHGAEADFTNGNAGAAKFTLFHGKRPDQKLGEASSMEGRLRLIKGLSFYGASVTMTRNPPLGRFSSRTSPP
ncbi:hypothetical protein GKA01_00030 [Gluconobacter kanchanaburiensis NBRC 103587]|uniref:Uncharacterized protein n=1 Tax=Gluconobacter kanchanaburiensis NBRC 103587 TaxID=1307948 RepID=A0A511B306_9PROT|nr:hypothetical protein GKA01_00030 [Gluconobacter kanchanaburiensis NBRC 103587]